MRLRRDTTERLFVEQARAIGEVLRRAVRDALAEHKRAGNPVAASRNGEVVILTPDQILVGEAEGERTLAPRVTNQSSSAGDG